jgi:hypothetical protein
MFTTKEVCRLVGLNPVLLWRWAKLGFVKPMHYGGWGAKNSHKWSPQQALGLAVISYTCRELGSLRATTVAAILANFEAVSDNEIMEWLGKEPDMWEEEIASAMKAFATLSPVKVSPQLEELFNTVCQEIHMRLTGKAERVAKGTPPAKRVKV